VNTVTASFNATIMGWGVMRGANYPGAKWLQGAPKSSKNVTRTFFNTVYLLPKNLRFEHGGGKLVSWPRRHLTSIRPGLWENDRNVSAKKKQHVTVPYLKLAADQEKQLEVFLPLILRTKNEVQSPRLWDRCWRNGFHFLA